MQILRVFLCVFDRHRIAKHLLYYTRRKAILKKIRLKISNQISVGGNVSKYMHICVPLKGKSQDLQMQKLSADDRVECFLTVILLILFLFMKLSLWIINEQNQLRMNK